MLDFKKVLSRFKVNRYFIIFLIVCTISGYFKETLILFTFVILHELCHVVFALIFKLKIKNIEIFPFGGVARIDNLDYTDTLKEVVITIAGPLFNIITAIFLFILNKSGVNIPYYNYIFEINLSLAAFNLLPGMPLDGGRVLRAILSYYTGYKKATRTAVLCGKIIAIIIFVYGIFSILSGSVNISLLVMPFFIFISASREENAIMFMIIKDIINKKQYIKSKGIMETVQLCVFEDVSVREILKYFEFKKYHTILVINNNMKAERLLTESEIIDNLMLDGNDITFRQLCEIIKSQ